MYSIQLSAPLERLRNVSAPLERLRNVNYGKPFAVRTLQPVALHCKE